ncbi:hypothetical protein [Brevundimonas sp. EYE_349]|uniref:hypothetical protein n=1 Tax=Brevundimonas sp. EYE_349 TaxID=2853455 RepID=UPI00200317F8|nr:hypothetical protein [Brevundimonas sp. EYE_349]MCK6106056.1 hypothetical protein [Brevundimonas sp. EYE_349]
MSISEPFVSDIYLDHGPLMNTPAAMSSATIEIAGRNWLTAQLLLRGFEVATPVVDQGVDLIVFREVGERGIRALPLQLKCASVATFGLDRKYEGRGIPLVYIWDVLGQPTAFFLTYEEALEVLGEAAISTKSWTVGGKYTVTNVGSRLREKLASYSPRWDWLADQLAEQPTSGSR